MSESGGETLPLVVDVTQRTCPMCGALGQQELFDCTSCGEPLRGVTSQDDLSVPLYSAKVIGICSFFWGLAAGMALLWLNCRRLQRDPDANKVLWAGLGLEFVVIVVTSLLPFGSGISLVTGLIQAAIAVKFAESLLRHELSQQRRQKGPYASTWVANGVGMLMLLAVLSLLIGIAVILELAGVSLE